MSQPAPRSGPSGSLSPFGAETRGRRWVVPVGLGLSIGLHALAAVGVLSQPEQVQKAAEWVEMTVNTPPPPPEPPPPPPEPEKPKPPPPKAQPVKFKDIPPPTPAAPTPEAAPARPTRRVVQGLSATSFATGSGTGLTVRAGNSTTIAASGSGMAIDDATGPRSFASVTTPPTCSRRPMMEVPKEAQEANVEGEIKVTFDVSADGGVSNVRVLRDLGHGTGEACAGAWRKVRCSPGQQNGTPVVVTGVPQTCTVRIEP